MHCMMADKRKYKRPHIIQQSEPSDRKPVPINRRIDARVAKFRQRPKILCEVGVVITN